MSLRVEIIRQESGRDIVVLADGMGSGVNVAVARGLGMGDRERVEKTVHTSFVLCAAFGIIVCLICVLRQIYRRWPRH